MKNYLPLSTTNLQIGYKGKIPIKIAGPLNFSLSKGNLFGLIGINGIGKSTLIKTLSGLLPPIAGQVLVDGKDIFNLDIAKRAKLISLVLTNQINGGLSTVEDIVMMGRFPYTNWQFSLLENDQRAIKEALVAVNLFDKKNRLYNELSDGNKQKVMIAKALAQDTPLMILDEPTVHLDIKNRIIILELLQSLSKTHNKTVLFSGHDLEYMLGFCDELMLMTQNKLIIKSPDALIESKEINNAFQLEKLHLQKSIFIKNE